MILFETPRLVFRPLTVDDAADLATLYADPAVTRFFPERYQDPNRAHEHAVQIVHRSASQRKTECTTKKMSSLKATWTGCTS